VHGPTSGATLSPSPVRPDLAPTGLSALGAGFDLLDAGRALVPRVLPGCLGRRTGPKGDGVGGFASPPFSDPIGAHTGRGVRPAMAAPARALQVPGLYGSPTIGPDGTIYVENDVSELYAVDPENGAIRWKFAGSPGSAGIRNTPAVSPNGKKVYFSSGGADLYALSAGAFGGRLAWSFPLPAANGNSAFGATPSVGPDGTIYAISTNGSVGAVEAVNPNGTLRWGYDLPFNSGSTPTVTAAGQVVVSNDSTVFGLQQCDGSLVWTYAFPSPSGDGTGQAASDGVGNVYIEGGGTLFAVSPAGSLLWTSSRSGYEAPPAIDGTRSSLRHKWSIADRIRIGGQPRGQPILSRRRGRRC
jgi:hypothetical protein